MAGRRFVVQVSGRHAPGAALGNEWDADPVHVTTLLRASVRDQSALQGLLRRIHDLGLNLVALHETGRPDGATSGEREYWLTIEGPLGETTEAAIVDFIGPIQVSTRYAFAEPVHMRAALALLVEHGAELEYAGEQPEPAEEAAPHS